MITNILESRTMQTIWIKKDEKRVEYCCMEKQEPGTFKIYSGIVGTDLEIQTIDTTDSTHAEAWLDSKLGSLKRKGFIPAVNKDYTLLSIRHRFKGSLNADDFQHKETFKKILNELFRTKGLGYIMSSGIKSDYWEFSALVLDAAKAKELINYSATTFGFDSIELITGA
ncbi:MAG: hypothetical protein QM534_17860 [Sediminibacterium sp.]|nr:hypothetical protein [Sediminibacterium sp.]